MAILIDPPLWPAHGLLWSHLVSDTSYDELHEFAARMQIPRRGFDLDHYDVPETQYERALELGAKAVGSRDVVRRLREAGLRVRHVERDEVRPGRRREYLVAEWRSLAELSGLTDRDAQGWDRVGTGLLTRWNEPHRSYHDERHLEDVLLALNHLATRGERINAETLLAAWFHDAVYAGEAGADERSSAALAVAELGELRLDPALVTRVGEMIVATDPSAKPASAPGRAEAHNEGDPLAHLLDADLSIFGAGERRYADYVQAVRSEYAHVADDAFREGRARILETYLSRHAIYRSAAAQGLWEERARINLAREVELLRGAVASPRDSERNSTP